LEAGRPKTQNYPQITQITQILRVHTLSNIPLNHDAFCQIIVNYIDHNLKKGRDVLKLLPEFCA
jgi:hypothetical protein